MATLDWKALIKLTAPIILASTPLAPIAPFVALGIQSAEKIKGASGPEKLEHAVEISRAAIAATNAQAGRVVVDPALADATIQSGINTVIGVANIVHRSGALAPK